VKRFLVDAQLPPALARVLFSHGHHAEHVGDVGMRAAEDSPIWSYALENNFIVVTKDEDFAHRVSQNPLNAPVVVWLRIGNTSRRALLAWFEPLL
jgi:predicted nuclease of predicted toxin-antitoxin system